MAGEGAGRSAAKIRGAGSNTSGWTKQTREHRQTYSARWLIQCQPWAWPASPRKKNSRRLELSISKNTLHGRCGQGSGSVDPRFPAGLPFPVPEIREFVAFRDSGKFFQQFSRDFHGVFLENPRTDPGNSHSLLEFSPETATAFSSFLIQERVAQPWGPEVQNEVGSTCSFFLAAAGFWAATTLAAAAFLAAAFGCGAPTPEGLDASTARLSSLMSLRQGLGGFSSYFYA